MNWYLLFYLYSIAEDINTTFGVITGVSLGCSAMLCMGFVFDAYEYNVSLTGAAAKKIIKWLATTAIVCGLLVMFIPSKKDLLLIVAGGAVGEFITTNPDARQLPADVTKFLRAEILSATAELSPAYQAERDKLANASKEDLVEMLLKAKIDTARK
jgi:hypothetical protein